MAAARLLCVGALTFDAIFRLQRLPSGAGKFLPEDAMQIAAGMAASAATAAARQGGTVALWASVGDDALGEQLIAQIAAEGVDCSRVRRVAGGRSAIAANFVDAAGERMIVPYYDPVTQADPKDLPADGIAGFDAVLVDVRWPEAAELALSAARAAGLAAILDADVAPSPVLEQLLPLASHIVASRPAAAILCGSDLSPGAAAAALAARSEGLIVVTDGSSGSYWVDRAQDLVRHLPAPPVVAIDTLAAGDVYHGCFALATAERQPVEAAIRFASAAAALKCTRFGGRLGAPSRAETLALLSEWDR